MESLLDPDSLRDRESVPFREETSVHGREGFDYFESVDGMVAVGVTNGNGDVLLTNGPHGWRLPYGPVGPGEDWVAAGRNVGEQLTDVPVRVESPERVSRIEHRLEGDDERATTGYDVVLRAAPVDGEPTAEDPAFGPWEDLEVEWFEGVPEDAYWDHEDAVDDVRRFLD